MDIQHNLLLQLHATTCDVLYVAMINKRKVKFGITHRPLSERVAEHTRNFDQFELIAVFTNFKYPSDVEKILKDWARAENALSTIVNNNGHSESEIIDVSIVPIQSIFTKLVLLSKVFQP